MAQLYEVVGTSYIRVYNLVADSPDWYDVGDPNDVETIYKFRRDKRMFFLDKQEALKVFQERLIAEITRVKDRLEKMTVQNDAILDGDEKVMKEACVFRSARVLKTLTDEEIRERQRRWIAKTKKE